MEFAKVRYDSMQDIVKNLSKKSDLGTFHGMDSLCITRVTDFIKALDGEEPNYEDNAVCTTIRELHIGLSQLLEVYS
jgi:hypothetical protein